MKRRVLQSLLGLAGLLYFFRFGAPAVFFGATGPGPLGERWLPDNRTATLLLDSDLRLFGGLAFGVGAILLWTIPRVEAAGSVIYILCGAIVLGASARIYARIVHGDPGIVGTIATVLEILLPTVIAILQYRLERETKARPK